MAILEKHILGCVEDNQIYLSPNLFNQGKRKVVEVLLEEYVHAKRDVFDRTREMQDTLISIVVTCMEDRLQEYL